MLYQTTKKKTKKAVAAFPRFSCSSWQLLICIKAQRNRATIFTISQIRSTLARKLSSGSENGLEFIEKSIPMEHIPPQQEKNARTTSIRQQINCFLLNTYRLSLIINLSCKSPNAAAV